MYMQKMPKSLPRWDKTETNVCSYTSGVALYSQLADPTGISEIYALH